LLFLVLLLSAAPEPAVIECVNAPQYDCKSGVYSGPPEQNLFAQDQEELATIYRDYWACHWQRLSRHADFGTSLGGAATTALEQARTGCQMQRLDADGRVDALLAKQVRYGDEKNRKRLREEYRGMGGNPLRVRISGKRRAQGEIDENARGSNCAHCGKQQCKKLKIFTPPSPISRSWRVSRGPSRGMECLKLRQFVPVSQVTPPRTWLN
jgi:hypothetical protein